MCSHFREGSAWVKEKNKGKVGFIIEGKQACLGTVESWFIFRGCVWGRNWLAGEVRVHSGHSTWSRLNSGIQENNSQNSLESGHGVSLQGPHSLIRNSSAGRWVPSDHRLLGLGQRQGADQYGEEKQAQDLDKSCPVPQGVWGSVG